MFIGALLDAGVDFAQFQNRLTKLNIKGFSLSKEQVIEKGLRAVRFGVNCRQESSSRNLKDIVSIIEGSDLSGSVKKRAISIFHHLAKAEAAVHNRSIGDIHFHETGAVDSIVDIVGSCIALEMAHIGQLYASPISTGMGTVECQHGTLPLPAPATLELLKGIPIRSREVEAELTTPTGAALMRCLAADFGPAPPMKIEAIGYGAGDHDLPFPNLLRVRLGELFKDNSKKEGDERESIREKESKSARERTGKSVKKNMMESNWESDWDSDLEESETLTMMECNLDDMSPEWLAYINERLYAAGALDVWTTSAYMKKGRLGYLLHLLAKPSQEKLLSEILFTESSSLGVRFQRVKRKKLERRFLKISLTEGDVQIKISYRNGRVVHLAPEYEDCRKLALKNNRPLKYIYELAMRAARRAVIKNDETI